MEQCVDAENIIPGTDDITLPFLFVGYLDVWNLRDIQYINCFLQPKTVISRRRPSGSKESMTCRHEAEVTRQSLAVSNFAKDAKSYESIPIYSKQGSVTQGLKNVVTRIRPVTLKFPQS